MSKVIVTGGAGFIGSHLTDELIRRGNEVIILDNMYTGKMSNIEPFLGKAGFVQGSVTDLPLLRQLFSSIDYPHKFRKQGKYLYSKSYQQEKESLDLRISTGIGALNFRTN